MFVSAVLTSVFWRVCSVVVICLNPLSANPTKWSSTLKQFVGNMPMNCLSVFDHFVGLALKGLKECSSNSLTLIYFF